MIKNKFKILILIFVFIFLYSCETATDALQSKKRSEQSDEFLIKKKNPLAMPPDYEILPTPKDDNDEIIEETNDSSEIKDLLNIESSNQNKGTDEDSSLDIESSILKKIE